MESPFASQSVQSAGEALEASQQLSPSSVDFTGASASPTGEPSRKKVKQTRNKPTLSCLECVAHKTKCDRGRPDCLSCIKRNTQCHYSHIANILASSDSQQRTRKRRSSTFLDLNSPSSQFSGQTQTKCSIANITHPDDESPASHESHSTPKSLPYTPGQATSKPQSDHRGSRIDLQLQGSNVVQPNGWQRNLQSFGGAGLLLSSEKTTESVFGVGGEHPFTNYWTCKGGLAEVVGVLPSKEQADILIAKYFEIVDPLYPILDRVSFLKDYEHFWSLSLDEKCRYEAAAVSLHFVIYATATQYIELPSAAERTKTAGFYISAGHQALRISSYLNRITITTVQTMVLIFYFLTNDNHVSDAWAFSGITERQAYVLQLNREPDLAVPHASIAEKNMRCKLWAAIIYQESSIALSLRLPSTSSHADVGPHSLKYAEADQTVPFDATLENGYLNGIGTLSPGLIRTDISYSKSIWQYAKFVQDNICKQLALGLPICKSNEHKRDMLSAFRGLYRSFPQPFGSYDPKRFLDPNRRVARQQIALTQNFFHAMMLICADENQQADVINDSYGSFEAAHEAIGAFFAMNALFGDETNGWWAYQHKAYEEAMLIANLLAQDNKPFFASQMNGGLSREHTVLVAAKDDVQRLLQIMGTTRGLFQFQAVQERRLDTLQAVFDTITVV